MLGFSKKMVVPAAVLFGALIAAGCKKDSPAPEGRAEATQAAVKEVVFRVEGMTCASCNVTVKVAAEKVRGVRSARADSEQGRAWVTFDPAQTNPDQIASAISETGYKATPLSPEESGSRNTPDPAKSRIVTAARSKLEPWQPADEAFRGCEGGCGLRVTGATTDVVTQPGAHTGQRTYCPMSGVVFEVKATSPRRDGAGAPLYFCCEACAQHFDANRDRILAMRGLTASN